MRILGPLVCSTTLPVTDTLLSASASAVTAAPSTTSSAGKLTSVPGSPSSFSTWTTSPTATLYCFPPVLTIAYIGTEVSCYSTMTGATRAPLTDESTDSDRGAGLSHDRAHRDGGPLTRLHRRSGQRSNRGLLPSLLGVGGRWAGRSGGGPAAGRPGWVRHRDGGCRRRLVAVG